MKRNLGAGVVSGTSEEEDIRLRTVSITSGGAKIRSSGRATTTWPIPADAQVYEQPESARLSRIRRERMPSGGRRVMPRLMP